MKKFILLFFTLSALIPAAYAGEACAPQLSVLCTINQAELKDVAIDQGGNPRDVYVLSTTFQVVSYIDIDDADDRIDPKLASVALAKLEASAKALKHDQVCNEIINNVN